MNYWYEIHGEGIPVVLLHGFTGSTRTWNDFILNRPDGIQLITIDLPGHGKTTGDTLKTMDECIDDLHTFFKKLNVHSFYLLGYSMGGRTALRYAIQYPDEIKGLILESSSPGLLEEEARKARRRKDEKLANKIEKDGVTAFVNYWENIPLFHTQKRLTEKAQQAIRTERLFQRREGLANSLRGMGTGSQASNWGLLENVKMPVLLLAGELDEKFITINKQMYKQLSDVTLEIIPHAGHAIHVEMPDIFQKIVVEFAKKHST